VHKDKFKTAPANDEYRKGYDQIWGKKEKQKPISHDVLEHMKIAQMVSDRRNAELGMTPEEAIAFQRKCFDALKDRK
jgi:hypothetical protein